MGPRPGMVILAVGADPGELERLLSLAPAAASVVAVPNLEEALRRPEVVGTEVLLVANDADRERGLAALAADGLPRWPVLRGGVADLSAHLTDAVAHHTARREAARARGDLLTMARRMSHEMRSPLGCILTSTDVLKEELAEAPTPVPSLLEPIVESANELLTLIERVSLVMRASSLPAPLTEVDMGVTVWAAREYLATRIQRAGAEVSEPAEWPVVHGVREWLERIWFNLIANALQHAGPRPRIELRWHREDGALRFCVRDQGPGVQDEIKGFLFRPFHRLHEKDSGRGLGLAIVQRLVDLQGGSCGYRPVDGGGSCFYFSLPDPGSR